MAKKTGRPTKANELIKKQVLEHLKAGLSVEDTAKLLKVARSSIYLWAKNDQEFSDTINALNRTTIQEEARKVLTAKDLVKLMLKKAKGFKYTEVTKVYDGEDHLQQTKKIEKLVPPDSEMIKQLKDILEDNADADSNELTINLIRKEVQKLEG